MTIAENHKSAADLRAELLRRRLGGPTATARRSIERVPRDRPLPLSDGQQQLWFLNRLAPDSTEYLVPIAFRVQGDLDVAALERAWSALVARHEILRTRYLLTEGGPAQVIDPPAAVKVPVEVVDGALDDVLDAATTASFDLERDWPTHVRLFRLAADEHLLVVTFHHIACDAWSTQLCGRELFAFYEAFTTDRPAALPDLTVQYADYATWQREQASGAALDRQLDHWKRTLAGLLPTELPTDRPRPAIRDHHGAAYPIALPEGAGARVAALAAELNTTPFVVLLTAYQLLVARYTGVQDVPVGTVVSTRGRPEVQHMVGYAINNLVLRSAWTDDPSFADLVARGRTALLDAYDHQSVPFARLVDELQPERDLSRTPLYQVAFTLHEQRPDAVEVAGLRVAPYGDAGTVAKVDLELQVVTAADGGLTAQFQYATALFDGSTMDRLAGHFATLLDDALTRPDARVSSLRIMDDAEFAEVAGGPAPAGAVTSTLHGEFERQAAASPHAVAVSCGPDSLTYAQVDARANRVAARLRALGVGPESLVGVHLDRGADLVPVLLGVLKAGAGYVPLDPVNPAERLAFVVADAGVSVVVADRPTEFFDGPVVPASVTTDERVEVGLATAVSPDGCAYVIYTSGSTGRPKGVVVTHANVVRLLTTAQEHYAFDAADVWSLFHSYAFDVSVFEMWGALLHGGRLVVVPGEVTRSPDDFLDLLVRERVTVLSQTPTAFGSLVAAAGAGDRRINELSLRAVIFAGERLDLSQLTPWTDRVGPDEVVLANMYGITETTVHSTYHRLRADDLTGPGNPIGRPLSDTRIRLLDQLGRPVPPGVVGEIHVAGPAVARGYLGRPELTAQRFVPDPYGAPGARLYRSGDLARRRPDGSLDFVGRIDHQVKIRGYRIELGEIQAVLAAHPAVREAVVVVREDNPGDRQLTAYLVPSDGALPPAAELHDLAGRSLPAYMVPSAFVELAAVPLTANGKLDQRALPAPADDAFSRGEYAAPQGIGEERIAQVWADVLGVERVGRHDGFFDLGGDSIRAVTVVGALRAEGFDLAVRDVFESRTVASLAGVAAGRAPLGGDAQALVRPFELVEEEDRALLGEDVVDAYPLSQIQIGMVVEMVADEDRNHYHNVSSFRIRDERPFSADAFRAMTALLVERHEVLRTSVHLTGYSTPLQLVHATADLPVAVFDLTGRDEAEVMAEVQEHVREERANTFDLERPSLMRFAVHAGGTGGWWLSVTECHPILEGWSHHSLLMELLDGYQRLRDGREPAPYDPPAVRFADAIAAELASLDSAEDRAHWRDVVDRHQVFTLPRHWGDARSAPHTKHQAAASWADLEDRLRAFAVTAGVSFKSIMVAAYAKVLSLLTDAPSFHAGLVYDTRPEILGVDQVSGMYLNTLPFPVEQPPATWRELVRRTFDTEVRSWPHRRFPLPAVQREFGAGQRLIEVFFNYQDFHQVDLSLVDNRVGVDDSPTEFPLTISSRNQHIILTADSRCLSRDDTERIADLFRQVLAAMAADMDGDARAAFLPAGEADLLAGWATTAGPEVTRCAYEDVEEQARRAPAATAVVAGGDVLTFAELDERANRLAHHLRAEGVRAETTVGVLLDRGAGLMVALLAVWKAGGAYVPLDPSYPADRIAYMLGDAAATTVVSHSTHLDRIAGDGRRPVLLDRVDLAAYPPSSPGVPADLDRLAYVIYTSGSTGRPKGVQVPHRGLANHLSWAATELAGRGVGGAPVFSSVAFDLVAPNLWAALMAGRPVHLMPQDGDLAHLGRWLDESGPFGFVKLTPSHLEILNQQLTAAQASRLTAVLMAAGEPFTEHTLRGWRELAPETPVVNEYGPTEASVGTCVYPVTGPLTQEVAPIGRPLPGMAMYVLDDRMQPVPIGVPGELHVGGVGVARGYAGQPQATAEKFVPDPFGAPGARLYRTGDVALVLPDGNVSFVGRRDGQVKIRGHRVELGEIEAVLGARSEIADVRVVLHGASETDRLLVAYVVPAPAAHLRPQELRAALSQDLPDYMVPSAFVTVDRIPLNANGKLDRRALPPPGDDAFARGTFVAARTPQEQAMAEVWARVLGVERVSVLDGFFELGGDSIRAVTLVGALRREGLDVGVRDVFEARTVAALAQVASARATPDGESIEPVRPFALLGAEDRALLPAGVVDAYPLSLNQTGMLVETLADAERGNYHNVNVYRVADEHPFVAAAFEEAARIVVGRHEVLRTSMHLTGYSVPMQVVHEHVDVPVTVHDVSDREAAAQPAALKRFVAREREQRFDLSGTRPPLRIAAHLHAGHEWYLVVTQHHALLEGWSNQLLSMEIVQCYQRLRDGLAPARWEAPESRFADVIAAELRALESAADREYWRSVVAERQAFALPEGWGDAAAPATTVYAGCRIDDLVPALREVAASTGVSLKSVLLAAHVKVLSQLTVEERFHAGLVMHARPELPGAERVYGTHLNTVPLAVDRPVGSWRSLVRQVFERELQAWPHRHFPLPEIQRLAPDGGRLVDVLFAYLDFHELDKDVVTDGAGFSESPTEFGLGVTTLDGLVTFRSSSTVLSQANAGRLAGMYRLVLESMAGDVEGSAVPVLVPVGERGVVVGGAASVSVVSSTVHGLFEEWVGRSPDAVAVVCGAESLTYAQVDVRASRVAARLRGLGVGPESLVGVHLRRGLDLVPVLLGVLKAGGGYVPLDPVNPVERLGFVAADAGVSVVVSDGEVSFFEGPVVVAGEVVAGSGVVDVVESGVGPDNCVYVIYTSGSTGRPKGVTLTHANLVRLMTAGRRFTTTAADVWSGFFSYAFDASALEIFGALLHGGRLVVVPQDVARSPEDLLDLLVRERVTVLHQSPSAFRALAAAAAAGDPRVDDLALHTVVFGGEKLEAADLRPWTARMGTDRIALVNEYGITETTILSAAHRVGEDDLTGGPIPIGTPIAGQRLLVLDRAGEPLPLGVVGELCIGGGTVARHYVGRPRLTAERFVPDPFGPPGARMYRSGDLARRRPDGSLEFVGRADDQVKLRGYRIEFGEIEAALTGHPAVGSAVAVVREDTPGDRTLVAYVVPVPGAEPRPDELREQLSRSLPGYMVPSAFVTVPAFPLTPNGKLDRRALPAPDGDAFSRAAYVAAATPVEAVIAGVWADVLGIARVGRDEGFFDLGGDSIRAVTLVGALRADGYDLSVQDVFEARTVAGLAAIVAGRDHLDAAARQPVRPFELITAADRALVPAGVVDAYPLSQVQIGMAVEMLADTDHNRYHGVASYLVRDDAEFSRDALAAAAARVAAVQDVLRTSFHLDTYSEPLQLVHESVTVPIEVHDLRGVGTDEHHRRLREFLATERARMFDLVHAPLLRLTVHVEDAGWRLSLTQFHGITEGWSQNTLMMDLVAAYRQHRQGRDPQPADLPPVRFADFVAAERQSLDSAQDRDYWQRVVAGHAPARIPDGWGETGETGDHNVAVDLRDLEDGLRAAARTAGASLKSVLLAAHLKVLSQITEAQAFHTGLVCDVRPEVLGAERVYGMYVNTLPFPAEHPTGSWRELIATVFAREVDSWPHRRYPLPAVQGLADAGTRLIDVVFTYQDFHVVDDSVVDRDAGFGEGATEFPLAVTATAGRLNLKARPAVLSRANAGRLAGMYRLVLESMAGDVEGSAVPVLVPVGERGVVVGGAASVSVVSSTVHGLFEEWVGRSPDAVAVVCGAESLTYAQVDVRASRVAARLRGLGVGPESLVGVHLRRGLDLVPVLLGVLKAGGGYVPLDPVNPVERLGFVAADAGVSVVVSDGEVSFFEGPVVVAGEVVAGSGVVDVVESGVGPDNCVYVIYTSGSTGRPKGVTLTHANVVRLMTTTEPFFRAGPADVWSGFFSYAFDFSVWEYFGALLHGGRLVLVPQDVARSPEDFLDLLVRERVTMLSQTPSAFRALAAAAAAGDPRVDDLALHTVVFGGEKLEMADLRPWTARMGTDRIALVNMYGITETTVHTTYHRVGDDDLPGAASPVGHPLPDLTTVLLDPHGEPVPVGVTGEVYVGGAGVARGYLGRPALTAERFVPDPYGPPGSRRYRSGDLARRRTDGSLEFTGRADDQVKIRGYRVELGEIQTALVAHPAVLDGVVLVREDNPGEPMLVAYVVPAPGVTPRPDELRDLVTQDLPDYMVPAAYVVVDALPLTVNGKLNRAALPAPDEDSFARGRYLPPRNPTEAALAAVWSQVLGVERVGALDDFFDLGGDSIRAVTLVAALRAEGYDVSVRDVFQAGSVAALAELLAPRGEAAPGSLRRVEPFELIDAADRALLDADAVDAYPLSQNQTGMLVETLADHTRANYHNVLSFVVRDDRPFSVEALREAVRVVVARHDVLRTTVHLTGFSVPMQVVHADVEVPCGHRDLSGLDEDAQRAELLAFVAAERGRPFDLARSELPFRVYAHVQGANAWFCTFTQSHAILEGWSYHLLLSELVACYRRIRDGAAPEPVTAPTARFADFIAAELRSLASPEDRAYWRSVVDGYARFRVPAALTDPSAADQDSYGVPIPVADLAEPLRAVAAEMGVPVKSVLLAAHVKVLSQLTVEERFHAGLVMHARPELPGAERVYGTHLNTVPLAVDRPVGSWRALVRQVFERELQAWPHRHFPLPEIQRLSPDGGRLLDVMFNFVDFSGADTEDVQLAVSNAPTEFGLAVHAHGTAALVLRGRPAALDRAGADRVAGMYRAVLEAIVADVDASARPAILPAGEQAVLAGASTPVSPVTATLPGLFEEQVRRAPDAVAVTSGAASLTYRELDERADRVAARLRTLGVRPESLVGVHLRRGPDLIPVLLGVLKAGGGYVPLDPANPAERLAFAAADAGVSVVVSDREVSFFDGPVLDAGAALAGPAPAGAGGVPVDPHNCAYVIYTSGSTGRPKGVAVTHANVVRLIETAQEHYAFDDSDVWSMFHSYAFDVSVFEMWGALLHGGRLVVVPQDVTRSPDEFLDLLVADEVTVLSQTPTAFGSLVAAAEAGDPRIDELSVRAVVFAGERLDAAALRPWIQRRRLGVTVLVNMYGITETTVHSTYHRLTKRDVEPGAPNRIGRPLSDTQIHLLDSAGELVPVGVTGEIHVGGPGVARAYLGRPELTAQRFVPDPFGAPGSRLYRSGDLAQRRPDGSLEFVGRIDHQVKIRGYRVELGEIQAALTAHPGISEAAVLLREDVPGAQELVGYLVPAGDVVPDPGELRALLALTLPPYMIPAAYVTLDALPLTVNGKLDRRALPVPEDTAARLRRTYRAPADPVQERVAAVYARALGLDRVGADEDFFDLGGDSIRAVNVIGALRSEGYDLSVRDLLDRRTVENLGALAQGRGALGEDERRPVEPFALVDPQDRPSLPAGLADAYPLTQNQTGMLIEMMAGTGPRRYHLVNSVRLRDGRPFVASALRGAVEMLVARHEVLRTSAHLDGFSVPMQVVHETAELPVRVVDVDTPDGSAQDRLVAEHVAAESEAVLDHRTAPLARITVHRFPDDSWQLTMTYSHVILEGWSVHLLVGELTAAYEALRDGREPEAPPAPGIRFADAVAAELRSLAGPQDRDFWRALLADREKFALPAGWGDPAGGPEESYSVRVSFADLDGPLRDLATAACAPMKSVLLAAHLKVLGTLTRARRFHTGLTFHTRPAAEGADRVYGMHLNTLPFPADRTATTWRALVGQVFGQEAEIWPHRQFPMPALQRELGDGSRLVDVYFSYQDFDRSAAAERSVGETRGFSVNEFGFSVATAPGELVLRASTRSVSRANADRLAQMYRSVLEAMAADADGDATAAFLPDGERERILGEFAVHPTTDVETGVLAEFEARVDEDPAAVAVVAGGERYTYAEVDRRANRLAHHLRDRGVGPETVVGVLLDRGVDLIVGLLAVWKAGGAYVPLDPAYPDDRMAAMLSDGGVELVVTGTAFAGRFAVAVVTVDGDATAIAAASAHRPGAVLDLDTTAYVIFTSGSTGRPKGVQITHRGLANHVRWAVRELAARGSGGAPVFSSVAFDLVVPNLWAPLAAGQAVHLMSAEDDLSRLGEWLGAGAPYSFIKLTPAHLELLATQVPAAEARGLAAAVVVAGEAFTRRVLDLWRDLAPSTMLINEYGPTETTVGACTYEITGSDDAPVVPIGRPLPGVSMYVLDEHLRLVPVGVPGELYVGGTGVGRGYAGRPALTADRFVPDPYGAAGARLYRTGDVVRLLPAGDVEFLGRTDHQVKIRGYRVEPGEIETVLRGHDRVRDAVVTVDEPVPGSPRLVAYVVGDDLPDAPELAGYCGRRLPEFMVPAVFYPLRAFPLNANGKIDRPALPAPEGGAAPRPHTPPATPTEQALARLWTDLLEVPQVGRDDSFFDLGGHSILVIRLVADARKAGLPLSLAMLYQHARLRDLATAVDGQAAEAPAPGPATAVPVPAPTPLGRILAEVPQVPGAVVARLADGDLVAIETAGTTGGDGGPPVTAETRFQAGSMSKLVTAVGVLRLVDAGRIGLDEDVERHLDGWRLPAGPPVTVRHLLAHLSGLAQTHRKGYRAEPVPSVLDLLHARTPADGEPVRRESPPGATFHKANVNYSVLQAVLENLLAAPFPELMRELVLDPFGLDGTTFDQAPEPPRGPLAHGHDSDGVPLAGGWLIRPDAAAAGMWTTAGDMAALLCELRRSYLGRPRALLRPDTARAMLTAHPGSAYGLGAVVDDLGDDRQFGHAGQAPGYHALGLCTLRRGNGFVFLANGDRGDQVARALMASEERTELP
ncbi:amino acid adenylation domain-containing protein [Micromonospora sp. NPDC051300]|uniref:amino acid adenylation domain-containing protein n=1 Tax=Micromonospora sp. NPDC051300 TaxID=3364286 RepID=UPI0037BD9B3E